MSRLFFILFFCSLASCDLLNSKPSETVIYTAPLSGTSRKDSIDATYLRIRVMPIGYEVFLLDKFLATDNLNAIDSFIFINKNLIDSSKVLITSSNDSLASYQKLGPVLKKYKIARAAISIE